MTAEIRPSAAARTVNRRMPQRDRRVERRIAPIIVKPVTAVGARTSPRREKKPEAGDCRRRSCWAVFRGKPSFRLAVTVRTNPGGSGPLFGRFAGPEAEAFKTPPGPLVPAVDLVHPEGPGTRGLSPVRPAPDDPAPDPPAAAGGVADDDGHVRLPEGDVADREPAASFLLFNPVEFPLAVQIFVHPPQLLRGIGLPDAVDEVDRFGVLVPGKCKGRFTVVFPQAEGIVYRENIRLGNVGDRHGKGPFFGNSL